MFKASSSAYFDTPFPAPPSFFCMPTFVSSMSARGTNSVSVGPGLSTVTVTVMPLSFSSFLSAEAMNQ
jgi:hypothetical protein